jgi:hypothetical protein
MESPAAKIENYTFLICYNLVRRLIIASGTVEIFLNSLVEEKIETEYYLVNNKTR